MKHKLAVVAVGAFLLSSEAHAVPITFFGSDTGLGDGNGQLLVHPNADAARDAFLASLVGVGTETFDSGFAHGAAAPLALTFPGAGTATLTGSGEVMNENFDPVSFGGAANPSGEWFGRFAISDDFYYGQVVAPGFSVLMSDPVAAFGFYATDIGDFSGTLTLELANGGVTIVPVPVPLSSPGGGVLYFGVIDTANPFVSVTFNASAGSDAFGFDDLTIGSVEQVRIPEPATLALLSLGLLGLVARRRKSRR
jgi:hypothetical protein